MPASSNSIDLSRLPAPIIVPQLTFEEIVTQMVADVQARLPSFDATIDSDPAVKVLQAAAYREMLIRRVFNDGALQLLVAYAGGAALDHLGALVGVFRLVLTPADAQAGTEAVYEDDDALRQRIVLAPESFSVAGPELAYIFHAKSASAEVLDASASSPAPGEVLVSVLSAVGDGTASTELLATVAAVVTARDKRPLGDAVTVASANIVNYAVAATLYTFSGPDIGLVLEAARTSVLAYIARSRRLGRDITLSGLTAALMAEGVQRVEFATPLADVVCNATQAAWCTYVQLGHGGYAE